MKNRTASFLLFTIVSFSSGAAADPSTEKVVSLDEIRAMALRESPLTKQIDADFAAELAEAIEVKQLPNPDLGAELKFPVNSAAREGDYPVGVSLTQPLRLSYFGTRARVAELIEKAGSLEQKVAVFELSQKISLSYVRLWALQEQLETLNSARQRVSKQAFLIRQSAAKGLLGAGDEKIFLAEVTRLEAQSLGLEAQIQNAYAELTAHVGSNIGDVKTVRPTEKDKLLVEDVLKASDESEFSRQSRATLASALAEEQERVARRDAFPAFAPAVLYEHSDDRRDFIGVGLTVELPFSGKNQAEIVKHSASAVAARATSSYLHGDGYKAELAKLTRSVTSLSEVARKYEKDVIPAFIGALSQQEKQFQAGAGSILQFWQTQRELVDAQHTFVELWVNAYAARTNLSILVGKEL